MPHIHASDLIDLTDDELQAKLDIEQAAMESFEGLPGQKPAEFWTHVANANVIRAQLSRRKSRRER